MPFFNENLYIAEPFINSSSGSVKFDLDIFHYAMYETIMDKEAANTDT